MGILLVFVSWGYWKWKVQFYKYTIEIRKNKTDGLGDHGGNKVIKSSGAKEVGFFPDECLH